jgi:acyl-coenzyme A synthetase/AMP-(fatty) acid ligase
VIERFLEVAQRLRREQAICGGQECWSFGELADRVCAYGEGIGRSRKRPVIYSVLRPGLDQIALLMASMSVPTIYVPIDASISDAEMRERCALLPPDALVCDEDRVEDWEHRRSTVLPEYCRVFAAGFRAPSEFGALEATGRLDSLPSSVSYASFTRKSNGELRALLFSAANFLAAQRQSASFFRHLERSRIFCELSTTNPAFGSVMIAHLQRGTGLIFPSSEDLGDQLHHIRACDARALLGSSLWYDQITQRGEFSRTNLPGIEQFVLIVESMSVELVSRFAARLPPLPVQLRYWIPESAGALFQLDFVPPDPGCCAGSLGRPVAGVEVARLPDPGSGRAAPLRVRAPSLAIAFSDQLGDWDLLADEDGFYDLRQSARTDGAKGVVLVNS